VDLETALVDAQRRLERATKARAPKHKGGEVEEYLTAHNALLVAERELAAAKDEPYAVPINFPVQWDTGAPLPYLLQSDYRTFLVFFLRDTDPDWDGSYVNIRYSDSPSPSSLAIVEFKRCLCTKMGTPNEEVLHGHPLNGKGLEGYRPLRVENSIWIKELEAINSVHPGYKPERWRKLNHYFFGFHDCTFECIAESFEVEQKVMPAPEALSEICAKLVE